MSGICLKSGKENLVCGAEESFAADADFLLPEQNCDRV
jgi:hypothetical protein